MPGETLEGEKLAQGCLDPERPDSLSQEVAGKHAGLAQGVRLMPASPYCPEHPHSQLVIFPFQRFETRKYPVGRLW